ncbi:hypothetical protein DPEC_G00117210 [Dallia pectoralis]|uniref:Uncharacterized protein n=1 Tax=Dallia pectoralis TaxID=75939 RepID=A0ACC2GV52_DALPE|nr:hypothetical protein DPEC_G00117210 [Dallia pectoralis]
MTEESKTVTAGRGAGDLTASYCVHDWIVALAVILAVWAILIIYKYIQTVRAKRLQDGVHTKLETDRDDRKDTTNEENVSSTEKCKVVPDTLKNCEEEEWRSEPVDGDEEPIGEIPVTSEDAEDNIMNPTITNKEVEGIVNILTMPNVDRSCGTEKPLPECPGDDTICFKENLVDILTLTDLQEPGELCDTKTKETENRTTNFCDVETAIEMHLTEAPPELRCEVEMGEVEHPGAFTGSVVFAKEPQEEMPVTKLAMPDVDNHLPDNLCNTEIEEIKCTEYMTSCVANKPEDDKLEMPLSDTKLQSEMGEIECLNFSTGCYVAVANTLESRNVPKLGTTNEELELEHLLNIEEEVKCLDDAYCQVSSGDMGKEPGYVVKTMEEKVECLYDKQIHQNPEHLGEYLLESDPDCKESNNVCEEQTSVVQFLGHDRDAVVEEALEYVAEVEPEVTLSDCEHVKVCDAVLEEAPGPVLLLDATMPVGVATEPQEESCTVVLLERGSGVKVEDVEHPDADITSHKKVDSKMYSVEDDTVIVADLGTTGCVPHDCAVEGLIEAGDGGAVSEEVEGDESSARLMEESHEKIEINIMEATMDCNEWIAASASDREELMDSVKTLGELKQRRHQTDDPPHDSAGSVKQVKEARATFESFDGGLHGKKMAAVLPIKHKSIRVRFSIHYHTHSPQQELAVTGNLPELGSWKGFVPLERGQGGFWVSSFLLPVERQVEWKFVLVEDGMIKRWEECVNRCLETGSGGEELVLSKWWGFH